MKFALFLASSLGSAGSGFSKFLKNFACIMIFSCIIGSLNAFREQYSQAKYDAAAANGTLFVGFSVLLVAASPKEFKVTYPLDDGEEDEGS